MKKFLKVFGIVIVVLVIFLASAPFLFKGTIEKQVKKAINKNVNATVEWDGLGLSLFSSFPDARLKLKGISVINKAPFEGDTLVYGKSVYLDMDLPQFWKGEDEPLSINELGLDEVLVNVLVNEEGVANYDIALKDEKEKEEEEVEEEESFALNLNKYKISKSQINYLDEKSKMFAKLKDLNHQGKGDFSADESTLETKTNAYLSFVMDSTEYFNKTALDLAADIHMDLNDMKFTFEENELLINQLPLSFDGWYQLNDDNQEVDLTFSTPSSDFKNFLGIVPEEYTKDLDNVDTHGNFSVNGKLAGIIEGDRVPTMNVVVKSEDAYFKYPDLPKAVEDINFDVVLINESGSMDDFDLDLNQMTFRIDEDQFSGNGNFSNLTGNTKVDIKTKGRLDLAKIDQAYPVDLDMDLNGILDADMRASFMMDDIEKEHYENVDSRGSLALQKFKYTSEDMANPVEIDQARLKFNSSYVDLEQMDLKTGETDAQFTGKLENLMGFLFKKQPIKGNFNLKSNRFVVDDFMVADAEEETKEDENQPDKEGEENIKIPSILDLALNIDAKEVLYDNLTLKNVGGSMGLKDEKASLQNITADIFQGNIGLDGSVSTKTEVPKFDLGLALNDIDINESVANLEMLEKLAPITQALSGKLTTKINLNGDLTDELSPSYETLSGDGMAELLQAVVEKENLPLVSKLSDKLDFINMNEVNLKDILVNFSFEDGGINFEPFNFKIHKDIDTELLGRHTFGNEMDYTLNLDVPAHYLGSDVSSKLSELSETDLADMIVNVPVTMKGNLTSPKIKVDLESATKEIANKIIEKQKEKYKNKAKEKADEKKEDIKDKAKDKLNDLLGEDKKKDSDDDSKKKKDKDKKDKKEETKDKAKDKLKDLFGK